MSIAPFSIDFAPLLPRRTALKALAAFAGLQTVGLTAVQAQSEKSLPGEVWRVLSRVGYGPTPPLLQAVQSAPSSRAWALQQVDLAYAASMLPPVIAPDLKEFNEPLPKLFEGARNERQARARIKAGTPADEGNDGVRKMDFSSGIDPLHFSRTVAQQSAAWHLSACSQPDVEIPLLARMTEFWFNHLNVYGGKGSVRPFTGHYLVNVARAHALGKFEDLLLASARHPAMLHYLDQAKSVADGTKGGDGKARGLNENYARELMELHTLGVNGGYTQTDVRELARVLTGWTISPENPSGFRFVPRQHDSDSKVVMGQRFPDGLSGSGEREGIDAIRMLARHPNTAARISLRLAQFFVSDTPSPQLVQHLRQTFLGSQGDMRTVMRALLNTDDFWRPENQLFKTPMDYACSTLAAIQGTPERRNLVLAMGFLNNAGQTLHGWQTPDGYKTDKASWLVPEALTRRADFALAVARQTPELKYMDPFLSAATRQAISQEKPGLRAGLALASPDFMYK